MCLTLHKQEERRPPGASPSAFPEEASGLAVPPVTLWVSKDRAAGRWRQEPE